MFVVYRTWELAHGTCSSRRSGLRPCGPSGALPPHGQSRGLPAPHPISVTNQRSRVEARAGNRRTTEVALRLTVVNCAATVGVPHRGAGDDLIHAEGLEESLDEVRGLVDFGSRQACSLRQGCRNSPASSADFPSHREIGEWRRPFGQTLDGRPVPALTARGGPTGGHSERSAASNCSASPSESPSSASSTSPWDSSGGCGLRRSSPSPQSEGREGNGEMAQRPMGLCVLSER